MHITGMSIQFGTPPFAADGPDFKFDERVNVFTGPNASGKSSLLRMLGMPVHVGDADVFQYICQFAIAASEDWPVVVDDPEEYGHVHRWAEIPWVQIPATRLSLPWAAMYGEKRSEKAVFLSDDTETLASIFRHGYEWGVFDANQVERALLLLVDNAKSQPEKAESWPRDGGILARLRTARSQYGSAGHQLDKAMGISYTCARQISREIVTGSEPHNLVTGETDFHEGLFVQYPDIRLGMAVDILDRDSVAVNVLSSGTQSSLLWIRFLALQMLYHYDFEDGWEKRPAILLIDEIENHLHPTWQRRVIPALLEHFPGLQIFATTHSPFVVAGLKAGQVHMLKRDENGVVTASTNERDIIGWTTDEILRTFMGVDEPTDQLTIDRYQRLRELRGKEILTDEAAAEMEDLRRQVNEDFLSSSTPLEAQRERYGDMMLKFLRSRQSELSQDGD